MSQLDQIFGKNSRQARQGNAVNAAKARTGLVLGLAVEAGKITLMRIDREGRKVTQTPVAGPVPATDVDAIVAMCEGFAG